MMSTHVVIPEREKISEVKGKFPLINNIIDLIFAVYMSSAVHCLGHKYTRLKQVFH